MRRKLIGLLGLVMAAGILMGMSKDDAPVLYVSEESVPESGKGIYNEQEQVSFVLRAEKSGDSDIVSISCIAEDYLGHQRKESWPAEAGHTMIYHPDLSEFADGEIHFSFWTQDQAGHTGLHKTASLRKDGTRPIITGRLETSGRRNDDYYSGDCQIYLYVQDDNLDDSWRPVVESEDPDGYSFSGWRRQGNTAEGVISCSGEGMYQITFSCTDLAGNQAETLVVPPFIIDKTAPVISVMYDNQEVRNQKYYREPRRAVITIREKWFRPDDGKVTAVFGGGESLEVDLEWRKTKEGYQSEVLFEKEGINALNVVWKDQAGNEAKAYHSGAFVIDRTAPKLKITNLENHSSNNGKVEPVLQIIDTNMNEGEIKVSLKELEGKKVKLPDVHEQKISDQEIKIAMDNFSEKMDGIYQLSVSAVDLAGNQSEKSIYFNVNRGGSDYTFNPETEAMLQKIFIRDSDKVVICEKNVDWLSESSVIISCSGTLRELEKGKDYTVQAKGSETEKKEYTYTIDKSCFQNEGTYVIYVDSKDKAGNHSSIEQKGVKAGFILDRTAPKIRIINLEDQQYYHGENHNFQAAVSDNTELLKVQYYLDGKLEEEFSEKEIEEMEGLIELQMKASDEYQAIRIIAEDRAGNVADSGKRHVLVNLSDRTKKQNSASDNEEILHPGSTAIESKNQNSRKASLLIAGAVCILFMGSSIGYWYYQKKNVSIRRLPGTDDKR